MVNKESTTSREEKMAAGFLKKTALWAHAAIYHGPYYNKSQIICKKVILKLADWALRLGDLSI
jgi:hypothetical protein